MQKLTRDQLAQRVARDIPEGAYVNLGLACRPALRTICLRTKKSFCTAKTDCSAWGQRLRRKTPIRS